MKNPKVFFDRFFRLVKNIFHPSWRYFKQGFQSKELFLYSKYFFRRRIQEFVTSSRCDAAETDFIQGSRYKKLAFLTGGLHSLHRFDPFYSYSILIAVESDSKLTLSSLKSSLESAVNQTAPSLEVLIGCHEGLPEDQKQWIGEFCQAHSTKVKIFLLENLDEKCQLNQLSKQAKQTFLLPLKCGNWLRPDFLYRCEQFLRLKNNDASLCLYTDEFLINEKGYPVPGHHWSKAEKLHFPYHFQDEIGHVLLVSKKNWELVGGLNFSLSSCGLWELALRLDEIGCQFYGLPFKLYAFRHSRPSTEYMKSEFLIALARNSESRGLNWIWDVGFSKTSYRAIPALTKRLSIQVIIPYKNQRELTLKAVSSVLNQKNVSVYVTAVNNNSDDLGIADEIERLGGEVIHVEEPFNYSRLNNQAVKRTKVAHNCDLVLFLNNDVELEQCALEEMCRWIVQPGIGMVGCCLTYPNGLLQHGGVEIISSGPSYNITWGHPEVYRDPSRMTKTKILRFTDAVTAACALMDRRVFIEIGGFDEVWYPIAYSDTNLALKLQSIGLKILYTPYAKGIHYESLSRGYDNIEDVENSRWFQELFVENAIKVSKRAFCLSECSKVD